MSTQLTTRRQDSVQIVTMPAYVNAEVGMELDTLVPQLFRRDGTTSFLFDFSGCKVANSQGITALMDNALKVIDDFRGKVVLCGLDAAKKEIFTLVGLLPMLPVADTVEEGLAQVSTPT